MSVVVVGSYNHDLIFRTDRLPSRGETRLGTFSSAHGGKGFNQAIACRRLGADTRFVGAIGDDAYGLAVRAFAEAEGLDAAWQIEAEESTGLACVTTEASGENQITVAPGANGCLSTEHIESHCRGADFILTQLEIPLEQVEAALQHARRTGAVGMLNPAPLHPQLSRELIALADILTPNESEFRELMAQQFGVMLPADWTQADEERLHGWCRRSGVPAMVITLGARGCFVSVDGEFALAGGEDAFYVSGVPVTAVDSTGAGDAFNGALAAGLMDGLRLEDAVSLANRAAALSVTRPGAAPAMPTREEVAGS